MSFAVGAGETLGLVGESGSGKSMTCLSMRAAGAAAGRAHPGRAGAPRRRGSADQERGRDAADPRPADRHDPAGSDELAQPGVLRSACRCASRCALYHGLPRRARSRERAAALLAARAHPVARGSGCAPFPHQLSGGMRQRVVGAMAIAAPPRLLIADEPTTSLDLTIQAQYLGLLKELQQQHGLAMIFVTHNLGIVAQDLRPGGRDVRGAHRRDRGRCGDSSRAPAHPYTPGAARVDPAPRRARRSASPPSRASRRTWRGCPAGCAFAPRCPHVHGALPRARRRPSSRSAPGHVTPLLAASPADRR